MRRDLIPWKVLEGDYLEVREMKRSLLIRLEGDTIERELIQSPSRDTFRKKIVLWAAIRQQHF
jgi:hypothetical protein